MKKKSILLDWRLIQSNQNFRRIFIARMMSIIALGMLTVAVPMQIHQLTASSLHVGIALALDGLGMFAGLMLGGVLADKYERRQLILLGRGACGFGFLALAVNCFISTPSLLAIYFLSVWSGFFGAIGITALMASMMTLVGRENIATAGALGMLTVRIGSAISPLIGGLIIGLGNIGWNYAAAAIGTFLTLWPLAKLPTMQPANQLKENPLKSLVGGFSFVLKHKIIVGIVALGIFDALLKGVRVLFPLIVTETFSGGAIELGLIYSAVPCGAMLGALTSGWTVQLKRPGSILILCSGLSFIAMALLSVAPIFSLVLLLLMMYGYFSGVSGLLQYTFIQGHTPPHLLGRTNSVWTALSISGESLGAFAFGALSKLLLPAFSVLSLAVVSGGVSALLWFRGKNLRHANINDAELSEIKRTEKSDAYDKANSVHEIKTKSSLKSEKLAV